MPDLTGFTLYHRAVRDVRGDALLPLNRLKTVCPDVYEREAAKYVGREQLRREPVLPLDCEWGDVLFFSPVHPKLLLDAVRQAGYTVRGREVPPVRFWTVNASELDPALARVKFVRPWTNGEYPGYYLDDYAPFDAQTLQRICRPTEETLTRLGSLAPDSPLILWMDVPHVLYRGSLRVALLKEIYCREHRAYCPPTSSSPTVLAQRRNAV